MAEDKKIYQLEIEIGDSKKNLADMRLELERVRSELKQGNLTKEEAEKKTIALNAKIIDEKAKLADLNQTLVKYNKELAQQKKETEENTKTKNAFRDTLDKVTAAYHKAGGGINGMTAAAKAFIMTPIGAVITAITGALALFKKALGGSVEGQRTLNKITKTVSTTFDVFLQQLRNAGTLIKALFTFDKNEIGKALDEFKNGLSGAVATIKEGVELEDKLFDLERKQSEFRVKQSEYEKQISEYRRIAADRSKTEAERNEANQKVRDLTIKSINDEIALEQERLKLLKEKHSLTDSTMEDIEEERETEIRINNLITERNQALQRTDKIQNQINKSVETMQSEADKATKAWVDAGNKALEELDKQLKAEEELRKTNAEKVKALNDAMFVERLDEHQKTLYNIQQEYDARMQMIKNLAEAEAISAAEREILETQARDSRKRKEEEAAKDSVKIEQDATNAKNALANTIVDATSDTLKAAGSMIDADNKKSFEAKKALDIADTTVSTIKGATGAFLQATASYPPPYGQIIGAITAGAATASGIANIAKIKSQKYKGSSSPSASAPQSKNVEIPKETTTSSIQGVQSDLATVGQTKSVRGTETKQTQTVLVVDDVTAKQNSQNLIQKTSVM